MVLYLRLFDNSIHGWDLARAIGMGEPLDDETVEVLWAVSVPQREAIRASGHFWSAEIQVPEDAPLETRLLGLLGRQA